jgi:hypothetical protein
VWALVQVRKTRGRWVLAVCCTGRGGGAKGGCTSMWGWLGTECSTVRVIRVVAQSNYEELHDTASAAKCFPCCGCCMLVF